VPPVTIDGTTVQFTHGNVTATLDPSVQQNRPGLLLDGGVVYLAFGSCGDVAPYHGWVLAYDADLPGSSTFLKQLGVFNTSPEQTGGCNTTYPPPRCMAGIWQSGLGLAADGDGTVYLLTGNGKFDSGIGSYGNTLLRLRLPPAGSNTKQMQVVSFFTPPDWENTYDYLDQDLGAGGAVLFTDGSRRFILAGGKPPKGYLIDRDCPNCNGAPNWCNPQPGQTCADPPLVLQTMTQPQGIVAGPAHYTGPNGKKIYYGYNYQPITAFKFQSNPPQLVNPQIALDQAPTTSPIPTVSSNGSSPGTGIVWAVFHPGSSDILTLHAYDAENMSDNLFGGSSQKSLDVASWSSSGLGNSFQVPSVIHGKVYCGSKDRLVVFGCSNVPYVRFWSIAEAPLHFTALRIRASALLNLSASRTAFGNPSQILDPETCQTSLTYGTTLVATPLCTGSVPRNTPKTARQNSYPNCPVDHAALNCSAEEMGVRHAFSTSHGLFHLENFTVELRG